MRWWCTKYNRPRKDPLLAQYTPEELMLEFLEELIDHDPSQAFPQEDYKSGKAQLTTGDPVTDKWSREIAEGKTPDFLASFNPEDLAKLKRMTAKQPSVPVTKPIAPTAPPAPLDGDEFHDDYGKDP